MVDLKQIRRSLWATAFFLLYTWAQKSPPAGALIVRQIETGPGEYSTISAAVAALSKKSGSQTIFIFPGSYKEQVIIKYTGGLNLQGYSTNPTSAASNQVTVQAAISAAQAGSNVKSATIWAHSPGIRISNINAINSYGEGTDTQALALASTGAKQVFRYCTFSSFQDTVEIQGSAYFLGTRIEGATDFLFGAGAAWFEAVILAVKATTTAYITAQRNSPGGSTSFVINRSQVISAGAAAESTYLGRPWSEYASVVFQLCSLSDIINPAGWTIWNPNDPRTAHVKFQEYRNFGPGASTSARKIGTQRSSPVSIASVLGSDYKTWAY